MKNGTDNLRQQITNTDDVQEEKKSIRKSSMEEYFYDDASNSSISVCEGVLEYEI